MTDELNPENLIKGLGNMKELRFLYVSIWGVNGFCSYWNFDDVSQYFPNALRYLGWDAYPFCSLPKAFQPSNLVALQMQSSNFVKLGKAGEIKVQ